MKRGKLVAIGIGIAVAMMASFALAISAQSGETEEITPSETTGSRHFEVELKENISVGDKPPAP